MTTEHSQIPRVETLDAQEDAITLHALELQGFDISTPPPFSHRILRDVQAYENRLPDGRKYGFIIQRLLKRSPKMRPRS